MHRDKILVLLHGANIFVNCLPKNIIPHFNSERFKGKLLMNANPVKYGLNFIGDIKRMKEELEKSQDMFKDVPKDQDKVFFSEVEDWKMSNKNFDIAAPIQNRIFIGNPSNSELPMFILQELNPAKDHFHHFINTIKPQPFFEVKNETFPEVFVCVSVSPKVLFFEEFLESFFKQDYPRQKLFVQVQFSSQKTEDLLGQMLTAEVKDQYL